MAGEHDEVLLLAPADIEPPAEQLRANPQPLVLRQDGQRPQGQRVKTSLVRLHGRPAEGYVSDYPVPGDRNQ